VCKLRVQNYFLWVSRGFVSHCSVECGNGILLILTNERLSFRELANVEFIILRQTKLNFMFIGPCIILIVE